MKSIATCAPYAGFSFNNEQMKSKVVLSSLPPIALETEQAAQFVALSVSTMEKLVRLGEFPKPRQLSPRRVAFLVRELVDWMESRPISDLLPPPNTGAAKPRESHNPARKMLD